MLGIYDSGLGGLTALVQAKRLMPSDDFIYFADTLHLPYGTRSPETIVRYAASAMNFFSETGVSAVLCACGTVSSVALCSVKDKYKFPIIGVADPSVAAAAETTKSGKIAVIATGATVRSGYFERKIREYLPDAVVMSKSCDLFVGLVEAGVSEDSGIAVEAAREYLSGLEAADTVILGCTHFPMLSNAIAKVLPDAKQIDSGLYGAKALLPYSDGGNGKLKFYVSDSHCNFKKKAESFLGYEVTPLSVNIESY